MRNYMMERFLERSSLSAYRDKFMLDDRSINVWAYNLETVLAEKLETIITRTTTNTRMRDFYDIAILQQLISAAPNTIVARAWHEKTWREQN